jgi:hypothetical protein
MSAAALAEGVADVASEARHLRAAAEAREAAELDRAAAREARRETDDRGGADRAAPREEAVAGSPISSRLIGQRH